MNIAFIAPLQRAWGRMERMLFRPFRIETWLVMGFAAFLSELLTGGSSGFGGRYREHHGAGRFPHEFFHRIVEFFSDPAKLMLAIVAGCTLLVIFVVLLWVSCRGRFIFLDNVVHERPAIVDPWSRYARQGNSLFAWSLGFLLVCAVALMVVALPFIASLRALWGDGEFHWAGLLSLAGFMFMAIPVALAIAYTLLFLNHFVVPIMYLHGLSATAAWGRFLTLLRAHPWSFIAYGLLMILLLIVIGLAKLLLGLSTCCVGFILLWVPYVRQVILLPVLATLRSFGPEFLAQFGPEFDVYGASPASPAPAEPPPQPSVS